MESADVSYRQRKDCSGNHAKHSKTDAGLFLLLFLFLFIQTESRGTMSHTLCACSSILTRSSLTTLLSRARY
jgi:hypothetical protein